MPLDSATHNRDYRFSIKMRVHGKTDYLYNFMSKGKFEFRKSVLLSLEDA